MPNNNIKRLLIIGEVFIDVHLDKNHNRLGGIFHSARAMNSLNCNYALAAITPNYLVKSIYEFGNKLGAENISIIGEITNIPNVMLIGDSSEAGNQNYNDLLRDQAKSSLNKENINSILDTYLPTDILIYPGKYNLIELINYLIDFTGKIHLDFQYECDTLDQIYAQISIDTIILSTSSTLFSNKNMGSSDLLVQNLKDKTKNILLKENRGGSRYYEFSNQLWTSAPAFLNKTAHSVGVGDCFNAVFLTSNENISTSLKLASYVASWYASTFHHDTFVENTKNLFELSYEISQLSGISLEWEKRTQEHIYIAAPDFPHIDTKWIDIIYDCLDYHNFKPHRPVKENGIILGDEDENTQLGAYFKDIQLLHKCSLLIAVLLNDDPGTYVEIGWMSKNGKPIILFDPNYKATNLFLKKSVNIICHTPNEVINATFELLGTESRD